MRKIISSFRRRPENKPKASLEERPSSNIKTLQSKTRSAFGSLRKDYLIDWIPACAGMTAQRGFGIITAIFLLVVLSFLGIAMVSFSTSQHQSSAMDVMGSRAYQAARAGIEWAAYKVVNEPQPALAPPGSNINLGSLGGTLAPFSVTVNWSAASHVEGASTIWIYDVSAVAQTGGSSGDPSYIERVISVKLGK